MHIYTRILQYADTFLYYFITARNWGEKTKAKTTQSSFSVSLDILYAQNVNLRGVAVLAQHILTKLMPRVQSSQRLFGLTVSGKLTLSFVRFFLGYREVAP